MPFWYLATPYSKFPGGLDAAYVEACKAQALLIKAGVPVFCPISHTHGPAVHGKINPLDHDIWLPADEPFMEAACGLVMLQLPSWEESYGMRVERDAFDAADKPIIWMEPGRLPTRFMG